MKLLDFENHLYSQTALDVFSARTDPPCYRAEDDLFRWSEAVSMYHGPLMDKLLDAGEARIRMMDELGIDTAILSSAPGLEILPPDESLDACRKTNDAIYALTQRYPGRYLGSAILPVKNVDAAVAEPERCVRDLGFVAWHTHSNYGPTCAADPVYFPIFQTAERLGIYVYLHPRLPYHSRVDTFGFSAAGPGLGFTVDAMTTALLLVISGLFDALPGLKVVLGHLGEALPFLLDRMDNRLCFLPNPALKNRHSLRYYFQHNLLVTTSGNPSAAAFACTKASLGIDRILFGSDYPYEDPRNMIAFLEQVPFTVAEREKLCCKNATLQLGLLV